MTNDGLQIEHVKYGDLEKETIKVLSGIVRSPDSWLTMLTSGKFKQSRTKHFDVFIAREAGEIVGWCTANNILIGFAPETNKKVRCIEFNICVRPEHRGKGIASKILFEAKSALDWKHRKWISFPHDDVGKLCYEKNRITTFRKGVDVEYNPVNKDI